MTYAEIMFNRSRILTFILAIAAVGLYVAHRNSVVYDKYQQCQHLASTTAEQQCRALVDMSASAGW